MLLTGLILIVRFLAAISEETDGAPVVEKGTGHRKRRFMKSSTDTLVISDPIGYRV